MNIIIRRIIGYYIDSIPVVIIAAPLYYLISVSFGITDSGNIKVLLLSYAMGFLTYYILMETMFSKTLGKIVTRTRILFPDNMDSKLKIVFIRTICRLIPFDPISFLFHDDKGLWHDKLSSTKVIKKQGCFCAARCFHLVF